MRSRSVHRRRARRRRKLQGAGHPQHSGHRPAGVPDLRCDVPVQLRRRKVGGEARGESGEELPHERDKRHRRRPRVAALHLQRKTEPKPGQRGAVYSLGADLRDDLPRPRRHHVRAGPANSGDQPGMHHHDVAEPREGRRSPGPESCVRRRHPSQRQGEAYRGAPVDAEPELVRSGPAPGHDRLNDPVLHGVAGTLIAVRRPAVMARQREHPGMLARAVAPERRRLDTVPQRRLVHRRAEWRMRPAREGAFAQIEAAEQPLGDGPVTRLARVRRAGQGQLFIVEAEGVRGAVLDERNGLERLRRRPPPDDGARIAGARHERPRGVGHRRRHPMDRFDQPAADTLDRHAGRAGQCSHDDKNTAAGQLAALG